MADGYPPRTPGEPSRPGWWQASDGNWYPPEQHPDRALNPTPSSPTQPATAATADPEPNRAPLLLAGLVVSLVIAGLAAFLLLRSSGDDADDLVDDAGAAPAPTAIPDGDGDRAGTALPTTGTETSADDTPADRSCAYLGPDDFDDLHAELRFTMPFGEPRDLSVDFALVDGEGQRFLSSSAFIESAQPGERFRFDADTLEPLPASVSDPGAVRCEILAIEDIPLSDIPEVPSDATCVVTGVDSFGDVQVELSVSNPTGVQNDLSVDYALRGDGVRFQSGFTFIDQVPPGETVRMPDDSFTDAPAWAQDLTCEIIDVDVFDF